MQVFQVLHDTIALIYQKSFPLKKENFQKEIVISEDSVKMVLYNYPIVFVLNIVAPKKKKKLLKKNSSLIILRYLRINENFTRI